MGPFALEVKLELITGDLRSACHRNDWVSVAALITDLPDDLSDEEHIAIAKYVDGVIHISQRFGPLACLSLSSKLLAPYADLKDSDELIRVMLMRRSLGLSPYKHISLSKLESIACAVDEGEGFWSWLSKDTTLHVYIHDGMTSMPAPKGAEWLLVNITSGALRWKLGHKAKEFSIHGARSCPSTNIRYIESCETLELVAFGEFLGPRQWYRPGLCKHLKVEFGGERSSDISAIELLTAPVLRELESITITAQRGFANWGQIVKSAKSSMIKDITVLGDHGATFTKKNNQWKSQKLGVVDAHPQGSRRDAVRGHDRREISRRRRGAGKQ